MTNRNQPFRQLTPRPATGGQIPRLPPGAGWPVERPVIPVDWFRRMPQGGTVFVRNPQPE